MTPDRLRARLTTYLARHHPGPAAQAPGPLAVLTGGRASDLYTFTLGPATLVLKTYAPDAPGRAHATREWRALTRLRAAGLAVPHGVICEPDARHLGRPFVVMHHIPGTSLWQAFEAADPDARAALVSSFVAELRALHGQDPHLLEPVAVPTDPHAYIGRELDDLRRDSATAPDTGLTDVVDWLDRRKAAVPCERPAILHRDYHPWNVVVDTTGTLWVLDWDWQIGDARFDLAWTCTLMRRSGFPAFSSAVRDEYVRQGGRALDDVGFFEVLTTVRWLLNVLPATDPDFRAFLVEPVRRAQTFLQEHTGISVHGQL